MRNPVRYWDVKTGKCMYIGTLVAYSYAAKFELVTVGIRWWGGGGGVADNSLTMAFKEYLSCGSMVLCREPKALFLG